MFDRLVDLLVNFIELFYFACTIRQYEQGVVFTLGKATRVLKPGFHFVAPFGIEEVFRANVVPEARALTPQAITTRDGVGVVITAVLTWSIRDIKTYICEVENAEGVLADASRGNIRRLIAGKTWDELREAGGDLDTLLTKAVRRQAFRWGIEVHTVTLADVARARTMRVINDAIISTGGMG